MAEELALVLNIEIGNRDFNEPGVWFNITSLSGNSMLVIPFKDSLNFIRESQCYKLSDLKNKCCVVDITDHTMTFKRWFP